ncbi:MAG: septum formation initiator family protein [bacterium]|nr:septum formation initiator family protein [bacterium]
MTTFGQRRDPVRLFGKRLLLIVLFLIVTVAISGVWKAYRKEQESLALRKEAEVQLADLTQRKAQLEADIAKLNTPRGMEDALREQYLLAKTGENLIIIVDPPTPAPIEATSSVMNWFRTKLKWW